MAVAASHPERCRWLVPERELLVHALRGDANALELALARNLRYQQNLTGRRLAILTLWTTSWPKIQQHLPEVAVAVNQLTKGDFVELSFP